MTIERKKDRVRGSWWRRFGYVIWILIFFVSLFPNLNLDEINIWFRLPVWVVSAVLFLALKLHRKIVPLVLSPFGRKIVLAGIGGGMMALSFPMPNIWILAWFSLIPLFYTLEDATIKESFWLGFAFGSTFYWGTLYWLEIYFIIALPFVAIGTSAYIGVAMMMYQFLKERLRGLELIFGPMVWVLIEYLRTLGYLDFPFNISGYSQHGFLQIVQVAAITGVWGPSFLIALTGVSLAKVILKWSERRWRSLAYLVPAAVLVSASLIYGFLVIPEGPVATDRSVGMVQLNLNSWVSIRTGFGTREERDRKIDQLFTLSRLALEGRDVLEDDGRFEVVGGVGRRVDFLFWAETTVPEKIFERVDGKHILDPTDEKKIARYTEDIERAKLMLSSETDPRKMGDLESQIESLEEKVATLKRRDMPYNIRKLLGGTETHLLIGTADYIIKKDKGKTRYNWYNSAFLVNPQGEVVGKYDKMNLVAFGEETVPFADTFVGKLISNLINSVVEGGAGGYAPSPTGEHTVFRTPKGNFSVIICFEGAFGNLTRQFVKKGAEFIVNISNDTWMRSWSGHYQHFITNVFRAVENRTFYVRAGNDGITAIIDPYGRITRQMPLFRMGALTGEVGLRRGKMTFYTRYGDVLVYALFWLWILLLIAILYKEYVRGYLFRAIKSRSHGVRRR
ncbi:MAG: apolipoprotein N-acyltransferase [bacterium]